MAMPNAVFFAFSGTPLDKKDRSTYRVFGPLLDKYSIEESQKDGATIPIRYEGRMPHLFVESAESVDRIFERIFADLTKEQQGKLKREYVTKEKIAEAPARIRKICDDLIQHFETTIQPNGYKGIVVAPTREAAVTYKKELEKLGGPLSKIIMPSVLGERGSDGSSWDEYYLTPEQREAESERFKDPQNPTQLLIVVDMLLVGYDAPIVQVLYLDHVLKEHTLLQAIARVNRVYDAAKTFGLIVDYCGITRELQNALAIFDYEDVKGALEPTEKDFQELKLRHAETMGFFDGIDKNDDSIIIEKFEPASKRDEFDYAFKMFSKSMDAVLPKKEAHPYINDFKYAVKIRQMLRTYYESSVTSLRVEGKYYG
jgi:type I restriction enzyme, R subunit